MRKLDKTQLLATHYKAEIDNLPQDQPHPAYTSSAWKSYYYDIVANLNWVQKGLCAYTEVLLQDYEHTAPEKWTDGRYGRFECAGQLDHYDPDLKVAQGWLWDNFFLVDAAINSKKVKGSKKPNGILEPDKPDFDPAYWLEYNTEYHIFIPNSGRTIEEQNATLHDINTLGLNWGTVKDRRQKYLNKAMRTVIDKDKSFSDAFAELYQFFTAFELSKAYMES
jgi:hypothetical protein